MRDGFGEGIEDDVAVAAVMLLLVLFDQSMRKRKIYKES